MTIPAPAENSLLQRFHYLNYRLVAVRALRVRNNLDLQTARQMKQQQELHSRVRVHQQVLQQMKRLSLERAQAQLHLSVTSETRPVR